MPDIASTARNQLVGVALVVDDEHPEAAQLGRRLERRRAAVRAGSPTPSAQRQLRTRNVAPLPSPSLVRRDLAAVQLDEVAHDREAEAEAAVRARGAAVGLAEALEHVRQEVGRDARAGVGDRDLERCAGALRRG